jgi:hypothetical protein
VNLTAFEAMGVLCWAGEAADLRLVERVRAAVERLAADSGARREMSAHGRSAVDGAGAKRVAAALVETFNAAHQNR